MLGITIEYINIFILVFARIGGMIFFNPLLSRRGVPGQMRVALVLGMTFLLVPLLQTGAVAGLSGFPLIFALAAELFAGLCFGLLFQFYYFMLFFIGVVIDMGFGLSMAKAFDPGTSMQVSLSGNFFQLMFSVFFFLANCHLIFIRLIFSTYDLVGIGGFTFGADIASFIVAQFVAAFGLIMSLALPFIATAFTLEISMGILMKLIPQISIFTIHFQLKVLMGMSLLFLFAVPTSNFIQNYINEIFIQMQNLLRAF